MSYYNIYELFPFVRIISLCMSDHSLYELFPFVCVILLSTQDAVPGQEVEESDQDGISSIKEGGSVDL